MAPKYKIFAYSKTDTVSYICMSNIYIGNIHKKWQFNLAMRKKQQHASETETESAWNAIKI